MRWIWDLRFRSQRPWRKTHVLAIPAFEADPCARGCGEQRQHLGHCSLVASGVLRSAIVSLSTRLFGSVSWDFLQQLLEKILVFKSTNKRARPSRRHSIYKIKRIIMIRWSWNNFSGPSFLFAHWGRQSMAASTKTTRALTSESVASTWRQMGLAQPWKLPVVFPFQ